MNYYGDILMETDIDAKHIKEYEECNKIQKLPHFEELELKQKQ